MEQEKQNKAGGSRIGAGRKKKDVEPLIISVPVADIETINKVLSAGKAKNRSKLYSTALNYLVENNTAYKIT